MCSFQNSESNVRRDTKITDRGEPGSEAGKVATPRPHLRAEVITWLITRPDPGRGQQVAARGLADLQAEQPVETARPPRDRNGHHPDRVKCTWAHPCIQRPLRIPRVRSDSTGALGVGPSRGGGQAVVLLRADTEFPPIPASCPHRSRNGAPHQVGPCPGPGRSLRPYPPPLLNPVSPAWRSGAGPATGPARAPRAGGIRPPLRQ